MVNTDMAHVARVKRELRKAGVTWFGLMKFSSRYLPRVIHPEEHIKAAVYGRYQEDARLPPFSEGMLVATDRRVVFINHKPGFTDVDEISYEMVAGVRHAFTGWYGSLILHTRVSDHKLTFANKECINRFVDYMERRQIESPEA